VLQPQGVPTDMPTDMPNANGNREGVVTQGVGANDSTPGDVCGDIVTPVQQAWVMEDAVDHAQSRSSTNVCISTVDT